MPTTPTGGSTKPWTDEEFEQNLKSLGRFYHIYHPFHIAMNNGECTQKQIQGWVANRFYYQINIPLKDAAVLANCPNREIRRLWVQRIIDHDGQNDEDGGIEAWLRLSEAVGLTREEVISQEHVLPGVRFAVDAYVNFVRHGTWQEAACSSLTEMFAPSIHQKRLDSWPEHYKWIDVSGYEYFRSRLSEARRDVQHGLKITLESFKSFESQKRAMSILQLKLDILWTMLDAMEMAYTHARPPYHCIERAESRPMIYTTSLQKNIMADLSDDRR